MIFPTGVKSSIPSISESPAWSCATLGAKFCQMGCFQLLWRNPPSDPNVILSLMVQLQLGAHRVRDFAMRSTMVKSRLDGLSHVARLAQFEASADGKGHPLWNKGFGHFPKKCKTTIKRTRKIHEKPCKRSAARLDGPGPKASVPLGSVHAWRGMHSVYIFCIPMHTIHFVARKVPRTHTTF